MDSSSTATREYRPVQMTLGAGGRPPSKHATKPGMGRLRIADNSSLRKLMRAANRGRIPAERLRTILQAMQSVVTIERQDAHAHRHYAGVSA